MNTRQAIEKLKTFSETLALKVQTRDVAPLIQLIHALMAALDAPVNQSKAVGTIISRTLTDLNESFFALSLDTSTYQDFAACLLALNWHPYAINENHESLMTCMVQKSNLSEQPYFIYLLKPFLENSADFYPVAAAFAKLYPASMLSKRPKKADTNYMRILFKKPDSATSIFTQKSLNKEDFLEKLSRDQPWQVAEKIAFANQRETFTAHLLKIGRRKGKINVKTNHYQQYLTLINNTKITPQLIESLLRLLHDKQPSINLLAEASTPTNTALSWHEESVIVEQLMSPHRKMGHVIYFANLGFSIHPYLIPRLFSQLLRSPSQKNQEDAAQEAIVTENIQSLKSLCALPEIKSKAVNLFISTLQLQQNAYPATEKAYLFFEAIFQCHPLDTPALSQLPTATFIDLLYSIFSIEGSAHGQTPPTHQNRLADALKTQLSQDPDNTPPVVTAVALLSYAGVHTPLPFFGFEPAIFARLVLSEANEALSFIPALDEFIASRSVSAPIPLSRFKKMLLDAITNLPKDTMTELQINIKEGKACLATALLKANKKNATPQTRQPYVTALLARMHHGVITSTPSPQALDDTPLTPEENTEVMNFFRATSNDTDKLMQLYLMLLQEKFRLARAIFLRDSQIKSPQHDHYLINQSLNWIHYFNENKILMNDQQHGSLLHKLWSDPMPPITTTPAQKIKITQFLIQQDHNVFTHQQSAYGHHTADCKPLHYATFSKTYRCPELFTQIKTALLDGSLDNALSKMPEISFNRLTPYIQESDLSNATVALPLLATLYWLGYHQYTDRFGHGLPSLAIIKKHFLAPLSMETQSAYHALLSKKVSRYANYQSSIEFHEGALTNYLANPMEALINQAMDDAAFKEDITNLRNQKHTCAFFLLLQHIQNMQRYSTPPSFRYRLFKDRHWPKPTSISPGAPKALDWQNGNTGL